MSELDELRRSVLRAGKAAVAQHAEAPAPVGPALAEDWDYFMSAIARQLDLMVTEED